MESLAGLRERRAFECRLTPDRALGSLDEAEGFLGLRGLLTRTADSALPSLYEACHEEAYQPGGRGFASWPATKWPWFSELIGRGYLCVAVHRGKNLLVAAETAALLDPICRADVSGALGDLIVAAVRAAVIAPESEVRRWFSWQWYWTASLVDDLVRAARLRRVEDHLTAR